MPEPVPAAPGTPELRWTTPDNAHSTHMEMRSTMHYAVCSCGWTGPGCMRKRAAIQDAMDHLSSVTHPYVPVAPWDPEGRDDA